MIYTSLAVLAMSASAAISPLSSLIHLHPHVAKADTRVQVTLFNSANSFRDVKVDGRVYTMEPQHLLTIKAPEGTTVYAASRTPFYKRGEVMLSVSPQLNGQMVKIN